MYLIFDTETTGLPKRWDAPASDTDNWPRCIQIAWQLHDGEGRLLEQYDALVRPDGFNIPYDAEQIHGISTDLAREEGLPMGEVLEAFRGALARTHFLVGQNVGFDINVMGAEFHRADGADPLEKFPVLDTCTEETAELCQLPGGRGGKFKLPTLTELHLHLFGEPFEEAHNATADVEATTRCFLELLRRRQYNPEQLGVAPGYFEAFDRANPGTIAPIGIAHKNLKKASRKLAEAAAGDDPGAEALYRQVLELQRRLLPPADRNLAKTLGELGTLLVREDRPADAEPLLEEALAIRLEQSATHWTTARARERLADCLARQGRFDRARELLQQAHDGYVESLGAEHSASVRTAGRLASMAAGAEAG